MPTLLTNTNVITVHPANPRAQAILIDAGRIRAVGDADNLSTAAQAGTHVVNLGGRTVVPGFNDCHMHVLPYGLDLSQADLSPSAGVTDIPALISALRRWAEANPTSAWVLGSRYDQNAFCGAAHPTRGDLDTAFPDRPVFVMQTSKHGGCCNSVALKLAGITSATADPEGGVIVRNSAGEPTGVLLESAVDLVASCIPPPDHAACVEAIRSAQQALLRSGVTCASDLNTGWLGLDFDIRAYLDAAIEGAPIRTTLFPHAPVFGGPNDVPDRQELVSSYPFAADGPVRLGPTKLFADGALTVRTAALREPFVDTGGLGMLLHEPEELKAYAAAAHSAGWQVATHAIGDRAIELVLDAYEAAGGGAGIAGRRHRVEHAMLLDDGLMDRFARLGVVPVMQPEFIARLGDAYVLGLGEERAARLNPVVSLRRRGIGVPFSSDCPIVPGAPLDGMRAAVRRTTRSGRALGPEERVTPYEALEGYTYWAAFSTFDENYVGRIVAGMRADLTVLTTDPSSEAGLDEAEVEAVLIAGEVVFGSLE